MTNFKKLEEQIGEEKTKKLLNNLSYIKAKIYILSWLLNQCDNKCEPNNKALDFEGDIDIENTNLFDFTEKTLEELSEMVSFEIVKAASNGLLPNDFMDIADYIDTLDYETYSVHRRFFNELGAPIVVEKILEFLFKNDEINENESYFCFEYYDFEQYPALFKTQEQADEFVEKYGDTGTLYHVNDKYSTEIYTI